MYKGSRRQVVVLKDSSGKIFDEAHFIVKDDTVGEEDMIKEANRIIAEYKGVSLGKYSEKPAKSPVFWCILGLVLGCITSLSGIIAVALLL